jgi:hypothetical protein
MTTYAVIGGLFLVLLIVFWLAWETAARKGRLEAENDHLLQASRAARKANEIDEDVARLPDSDLDRELRSRD